MIAWVSHHLPDATGKLIGGAEMTDAVLLENAPVEVKIISPNNWKEALEFEKVVITGTDQLTPYAMNQLLFLFIIYKQERQKGRNFSIQLQP